MRRVVPWMAGMFMLTTLAAIPGPTARARAHPDFSGTWTLDVAKSEGPMVPTSATLKVTQTDKSMTIDRTTTAMGMTRSGTSTYALDGSPSKNTVNANGTNVDFNSTAAWSDDVLVIKTSADFGGSPFSGTERYSLSADKKTLVVTNDASVAGQSFSGKQTFVKQ
jgi:hypothetical protein